MWCSAPPVGAGFKPALANPAMVTVTGKALESFEKDGAGIIKVLVNVKRPIADPDRSQRRTPENYFPGAFFHFADPETGRGDITPR